MPADFLPLTVDTIGRVLPFMAALYSQDALDYDTVRAGRVAEWLIGNPDCGAIWLIRWEGRDVGYLAITVCVSIEFHGRFAMLDELYVDASARNHRIGPDAVAFATEWARARGFAALRLEVAADNDHARHVYKKAGFRVHQDRRLMTKWLK